MGEGLNYLFNPPRSIAIIGATAREGGSVGGVITRNLLTKFRGGRVYLSTQATRNYWATGLQVSA